MRSLKEEVLDVVQKFVDNGELFTALDVSNKVKTVLPFSRHREIRDEVRELYRQELQYEGYTRTPIEVTLSDNSTTEALLYHPTEDSFDLDVKYDAQKRAQGMLNIAVQPTTVTSGFVATTPATVAPTITTAGNNVPATSVVTPAPLLSQVVTEAKDLWNQLFKNQPSLFPRK